MQSWVKRFRDIFDSDNYHPVQVNTPDEYQKTLEAIPYESSSLEEAPFPKYFPFSNMVVQVYTEVKNFILGCVKFSEDLNLSPAEIDETVRKSTNILLTRTLSGCLSSLIRRDNLSLQNLIQIDINTYHMEDTNIYLEKHISEITGTSSDANHIARLQGTFNVVQAYFYYLYILYILKAKGFVSILNFVPCVNNPLFCPKKGGRMFRCAHVANKNIIFFNRNERNFGC